MQSLHLKHTLEQKNIQKKHTHNHCPHRATQQENFHPKKEQQTDEEAQQADEEAQQTDEEAQQTDEKAQQRDEQEAQRQKGQDGKQGEEERSKQRQGAWVATAQ
jgi:hypothetical protein